MPPTPPRTRRPDLAQPIEDVILRCLHKQREHRFSSAEELQRAWADACAGVPLAPLDVPREELDRPFSGAREVATVSIARPARGGPPRILFIAAVALLVLAVGGGAAWVFGRRDDPPAPSPPAARAEAPEPERAPPPEPERAPAPEPPASPAAVVRLVSSDPQGAMLSRDGEELGTTPLNVEVPVGGSFDVELTLAGHEPTTVTLDSESHDRVDVTLTATARRPIRGRRGSRRPPAPEVRPLVTPAPPGRGPTHRPPRGSRNHILLGMDDFDSERRQ